MSYAGVEREDETCRHFAPARACSHCQADKAGITHYDNGSGWCVGCPKADNDQRCTVKVRFCPVLNTPEQIRAHQLEDAAELVTRAKSTVAQKRADLTEARSVLREALKVERQVRRETDRGK